MKLGRVLKAGKLGLLVEKGLVKRNKVGLSELCVVLFGVYV